MLQIEGKERHSVHIIIFLYKLSVSGWIPPWFNFGRGGNVERHFACDIQRGNCWLKCVMLRAWPHGCRKRGGGEAGNAFPINKSVVNVHTEIWIFQCPSFRGYFHSSVDILHVLTRAPLGGYFEPPLVFLRYLLNRCRYHRQTCSTLSPNIFTHCVKILKFRVL